MAKTPRDLFSRLSGRTSQPNRVGEGKHSADDIAAIELELEHQSYMDEAAGTDRAELTGRMHDVAVRLGTIAADVEMARDETLQALQWLVLNSTNLLTFLRSGFWHDQDGVTRQARNSSLSNRAALPAITVRVNGMVYREAIDSIVGGLRDAQVPLAISHEERANLLRRLGEACLDQARLHYMTHDHNPVFAWDAYAVARKTDTPLPGWLLDYLDQFADGVALWLSHTLRSKAAKGSPVIGIGADQKLSADKVRRAANVLRAQATFARLHNELGKEGLWPRKVLGQLRKEYSVNSDDQVMAIYDRFRAAIGLPDRPRADRSAARKHGSGPLE